MKICIKLEIICLTFRKVLNFSKMNLYYQNLFKIIVSLIESAIIKAYSYKQLTLKERYINDTLILKAFFHWCRTVGCSCLLWVAYLFLKNIRIVIKSNLGRGITTLWSLQNQNIEQDRSQTWMVYKVESNLQTFFNNLSKIEK